MIRLSLNLPTKRRLDLSVVKERKSLDATPLFPNLGKIRRARTGNKISRFFRHIFEHKKINKILGTNLALVAIAFSFAPQSASRLADIEEGLMTTIAPLVLTTEKSVRYPLDDIKISQDYKFYHPGIDYDSVTGVSVYPIASGKIEAIQYSKYGYGNAILIDHGGNVTSLYAHLSKINVEKNQRVATQTAIGKVGSTGRSSGDHLHLEIRDNGRPINPLTILP